MERPISCQHHLWIKGNILGIRPQESDHKGRGWQLVVRIVFKRFEEF